MVGENMVVPLFPNAGMFLWGAGWGRGVKSKEINERLKNNRT
jgi:uncharacterized membrane protein